MDSSDFSNKHEEDEDIRLFREEYPDIYDFVLRLIDRVCDEQEIRKFIEEYDKETFDDIKKMIVLKEDDEDAERLKEEYPEEFYNAIIKMVHRIKKHPTPAEEYPKRTKYKKGDFIGQKYEIYDILGEGGFGIVYLVYSNETKSAYALKTFRDEYLEDVTTRERFKKEAQVWIDLERHPYLVRAYFVDEISGRLHIAMEHIASDETGLNTLEGYLRRRPPDLAQSLRWAIQFCHGMEHAYSRGIKAHRDIKPANIMIGQDKAVKISDFGLAGVISASKSFSEIKNPKRTINGETYQTMEGTGFGTPTHMPPEQFENAVGCDERSDIYSFGIVLYQMASGGKLPFCPDVSGGRDCDVFQEWYILHSKASIAKLKSPLFSIIQKCLEKNPINRYFSFKELRADIEVILKRLTGEIIRLPEQKELEAWEWNNKAVSLNNLNKNREAIDCCNRALKIKPYLAETWNNKGIAHFNLEEYQEAITCYKKALEINQLYADVWSNIGRVYQTLERYKEAMECYDNALKIYPDNTSVWVNKGLLLIELGRHQDAIHCCDRALNIDSRDLEAWINKGLALDRLGNHHDALICYDKVLEINPRDAEAWYNKGVSSKNIGKYQDAIVYYNKALEINPRYASAWYNQGNVLNNLGRYKESIACYDKVFEVNPRDVRAWYNKALTEDELGLKQNAFSSYKSFIELASPSQYAEQIEYARQRLRILEGKLRYFDEQIPIESMKLNCRKCAHFTEKIIYLTSDDKVNNEHITIFQSSCSLHGNFEQYQSGSLNKITIDETNEYERMLEDKANECGDFVKGFANIVNIDGCLPKNET